MKKYFLIALLFLMGYGNLNAQTTTYNWNGTGFGANGAQARRMVIGRVYFNQFHWGGYGNMKISLRSASYKSALVEYLVQPNPATNGNVPVLTCLSAAGVLAAYVKLELGQATEVGNEYSGGVNYYMDLYLEADYYSYWYVNAEVTGSFILDKYAINSSEYTIMTLFSSPSSTDIAAFYPHRKRIDLPAYNASVYIPEKLGIGMSVEPVSALTVNGNITTYSQDNVLQFGTNTSTAPYVAGISSGELVLGTQNTGKLWVLPNGNIGIGTSAPATKLSVNGDIRSKKMIVSQTGWPDYVFDSSYSLRPLSELETFISKHKHLPDIPSARDVDEKGISVGDNQALLLKKIEELTLYMISMNKEIIQLKDDNKQLKKALKKYEK